MAHVPIQFIPDGCTLAEPYLISTEYASIDLSDWLNFQSSYWCHSAVAAHFAGNRRGGATIVSPIFTQYVGL